MIFEKVLDTINRHNLIEKGDKIVLGISGGPDSVCLLHILNRLKEQFDIEIYAAHLNHQIRGIEAQKDALYVTRLCEEMGIKYFVRSIDVPKYCQENKLSIEDGARKLRYEMFFEIFGFIIPLIVLLVIVGIFLSFVPLGLWISAISAGVRVNIFSLVGMRLRRVRADKIIRPLIKAQKAGMDVNANQLESHLLSGGRVDNVVDALIAAHRANLDLSFERAAAIDLAGRNVFEAVKMSVTPKIIETPWISAVAIDGIEVKVIAKVTVRANLSRLVGGAGEETIIARVGEGIVTTVGSSQSHKSVLENPDLISRTVLSKGLDNGTAFEILSIDIADVDIGRNIGAHLQIQQAEADKQIAQAKAEERRATAIAKEQEMKAEVEHMKAKVVEAEAEVPRAMAEALRSGNLGVMDYYRMQNVQADTAMKNNVGNTDLSKVFHKEQCIETKDN